MYSMTGRIRYSEVDENQHLTASAIVNYFQDLTIFHSTDAGATLTYFEEAQRVWVVTSWQIEILRQLKLGDEITITTWPYDFKSVYGYRNFTITSKGNTSPDIVANSIWVLMDTHSMTPVKVTEADAHFYQMEEKLDMNYGNRKIKFPQESSVGPSFPVTPSDLDTNHHVNNGKYIQMAENLLPDNFHYRTIRAEYKKSAGAGSIITPHYAFEDTRSFYVKLNDETAATSAIISFHS